MSADLVKYTTRQRKSLWHQVQALAVEEGVSCNHLLERALKAMLNSATGTSKPPVQLVSFTADHLQDALRPVMEELTGMRLALSGLGRSYASGGFTGRGPLSGPAHSHLVGERSFDLAEAFARTPCQAPLSEIEDAERPWGKNEGSRPVDVEQRVEIRIRGVGPKPSDELSGAHRAGDLDWSFHRGFFDIIEWRPVH